MWRWAVRARAIASGRIVRLTRPVIVRSPEFSSQVLQAMDSALLTLVVEC